MRRALITGLAIAVPGAGLVALDHYYWSIKAGALAEDDFFDQCRFSAMQGKLEPGRYESVVWSERNEVGVCEDVLGYCLLYKVDGALRGYSQEGHQVRKSASYPSNCTYFGQLVTGRPQLRKIN